MPLTTRDRENIRALYRHGIGATEIARRMNVAVATVKAHTRDLPRQHSSYPSLPPETVSEIYRLTDESHTIAAIAAALHINNSTVVRYRQRRRTGDS